MKRKYEIEKGVVIGPKVKKDDLLETLFRMEIGDSVIIGFQEYRNLSSYRFRLRKLKGDWSLQLKSQIIDSKENRFRVWLISKKSYSTKK